MFAKENVQHPYPTDEQKQQLMQQTGLTRKQLTTWFTNSRKRLWKPPTTGPPEAVKRKRKLPNKKAAKATKRPALKKQRKNSHKATRAAGELTPSSSTTDVASLINEAIDPTNEATAGSGRGTLPVNPPPQLMQIQWLWSQRQPEVESGAAGQLSSQMQQIKSLRGQLQTLQKSAAKQQERDTQIQRLRESLVQVAKIQRLQEQQPQTAVISLWPQAPEKMFARYPHDPLLMACTPLDNEFDTETLLEDINYNADCESEDEGR